MSVSFLALLALVTLRIRLLSQAFDYSAVCYYGVALLLLLYVFFFVFISFLISLRDTLYFFSNYDLFDKSSRTYTFWLVIYYATSATVLIILYDIVCFC